MKTRTASKVRSPAKIDAATVYGPHAVQQLQQTEQRHLRVETGLAHATWQFPSSRWYSAVVNRCPPGTEEVAHIWHANSYYGTLIGSNMWSIELRHCRWPWVTFRGHFSCWELLISREISLRLTSLTKLIVFFINVCRQKKPQSRLL